MPPNLISSIIRILNPHGQTTGTGFVVTDSGLIATCAHVMEAAGARPGGDTVRIVFHTTGKEQEARVEPEYWRAPDAEDVAILRLEGPLPEEVEPLLLGSSGGTSGHPFKTFGFPAAKDVEGMWGYGNLGDPTTEAGQRVLQLTSTTEVTLGFSGAPVLDTVTRRVVGMVTSITRPDRYGRLTETAFITPTETLRAVCPRLRLSDLCPYQGLAAFTEADAEFFLGREGLVADLVAHLRSSPRFLAVVGPSGSGKSSVVQAGLFPALRRGEVPGSKSWHLLTFRPGTDPFADLTAAGLDVAPEADLQMAIRAFLDSHPETGRLVLFADQFEELFALCPESVRERFLKHLLTLLESDLPVTVVLALRADFYDHLLHYKSLVERLGLGQVNVPTMESEELRSAVEQPAEKVGLCFEPGLVETIVEEASQVQHPLPLLEAALTQLWGQREEGMLTHAAYQKIGRVPGAISQWAEDTYSGLHEEERPLAQRVFTRLVHYGEEEVADTRRRRPLAELVARPEEQESVHCLVQRLADARLLVTDRDPRTGEDTAEIIHDTLLWEWGRLRHWVTEQREFCLWRQRLDERLRESEEKERDKGALLRGALLTEAKHWLAERPDDLNPGEREYIQESVALRKRLLRRIVAGLLLVLAVPYLGLSVSYYFSTSGFSNIVIRAGHPGLKLLPCFDHIVVVTDYSLQDFEDPTLVSDERLSGLWLRRSSGYTYWGEQLFSHLSDEKAGLAYWRVGDFERAFARLAQGVASGDVESVKVLGYLALQSEAAVEPAVDSLVVALRGDAELHEAALAALAVMRDTQPDATAAQLESLTAHLHTTSDAKAVAVSEAIGILGAHDQAVSHLVLTELSAVLRSSNDTDIQLAVARALDNILSHNPDLLPTIVPDIAEFVLQGHGEVRQAFVTTLGIPSPMDPSTQAPALQATVEALGDKDPKTRSAGVTTLGHLISNAPSRSSAYLSALLVMAGDRDSGVRTATAEALALLPPELAAQMAVLETLISFVQEDEHYDVRYHATQALARIHDSDSASVIIETLVAATGDVNDLVRWGAVHALVEMGMEQAAEADQIERALRAALDDQSPDVRQEAAQGLLLLADQVKGDLTPALDEFILALTSDDWRRVEDAERLAQRFAKASPKAAATVAAELPPYALQADDLATHKVIDFLKAIGENQPQALPGVVLALADLLATDETADEANTALWMLRTQPAANLEPALVNLFERLSSASSVEREAAARAVGWVSMEDRDLASEAVAELNSRFGDPDLSVRAAVASSLGLIGRKQPEALQPALETLLDCLVSEQPMVRVACTNALAEIAAAESPPADIIAPPLIAALQDPSPQVRQEVARALSHLAEKAPESTQAAIEPLRALLSTENDKARLTFASALGILGGQNLEIASKVVTIAEAGLVGSDTDLREQAIWVLRDLGKHQPTAANRAIEALSPVLADPEQTLRRQAVLAIRDIGISDASSAEAALAALETALACPDSQTRWDAVGNGIAPIVRFQPTSAASAVSLLHDFLDSGASFADDEYWVQSQAWEALTAAYAVLAADKPETLWPLLTSGSAAERAVGREALMLAVAGQPDLIVKVKDEVQALRHDSHPHVRQSAAMAEEMMAIVQRTEEYLGRPADVERWYEMLEWLPAVGVDAARDFAQSELRELYPVD